VIQPEVGKWYWVSYGFSVSEAKCVAEHNDRLSLFRIRVFPCVGFLDVVDHGAVIAEKPTLLGWIKNLWAGNFSH
jgi:hypothetical protein